MAVSETQMKTWRLHRRRGEALPFYCGIAAASLVTPNSSLNIANILPAGTVVQINGQTYVTRNSLEHGQWGEIDPLNWHPTYIIPKKSADSFADRAAVYWDATNCYCTSTASGNTLIGYAVSNADLGSATNGTSSSLATGGVSEAYTVTGGTSADGKVGAYTSGDTYMEVELVFTSSVTTSGTYNPWVAAAAAGSAIGNATALTSGSYVVSGSNNAVGVLLTAGVACRVKNGGTGGLFVYPPVNGQINALGANNYINMATLTVAEFVPTATNSSQFYTVPLTPS